MAGGLNRLKVLILLMFQGVEIYFRMFSMKMTSFPPADENF